MEVRISRKALKGIMTSWFICLFMTSYTTAQENEIAVTNSARQKSQTSGINGQKSKTEAEYSSFRESSDTSFTFEKYGEFLSKVSDTTKYIVLPIDEFRKTTDTGRIVIGLRHDLDNDLLHAQQFSLTERNLGVRSTYYILHTAGYYLEYPGNMDVHNANILPVLKDIQDSGGMEIGWHNDLVTLQVVYGIDPVQFLHQELDWLRSNGIRVTGTASHGSNYCKVYWYLNFYFFEECSNTAYPPYVNNVTIPVGSENIVIKKGKLSDFNLDYEAYFLDNNKYFSDASFINGRRWHIGMLDLNTLKTGDRVIILLHPIHWHQASAIAEIYSFRIQGQKSCTINNQNSTISVTMPYGTDRTRLVSVFSLSDGSYARVSGSMQASGITSNNFTVPVTYTVYAENRKITREYTVNVQNAKNNVCMFESFSIPGLTKRIVIDEVKKSILVKVNSSANPGSLPVSFELSPGASAWIGSARQYSNSGTVDFTVPVTYRVIAENGVEYCDWRVTVQPLCNQADITSFVIPGMLKPASIDMVNKEIGLEVPEGQSLTAVPALFGLSPFARVYVNGTEQVSGLSLNDFTDPVIYRVISEDSLTISNWMVTVTTGALGDKGPEGSAPSLRVYPNPARDRAVIRLQNITGPQSKIEVFNSQGIRIHLSVVENTSSFTEEIDLAGFTPGIYIVKCSSVEKPVTFILGKN